MAKKSYTSALIIIGNEILSGRTKDTNAAHIGAKMNDHGAPLREIRVIPDMEQTIINTVNELRARFTYIFTTGGIGPTHDDITAQSVAKAFGVPLEQNPQAYEVLLNHYGKEELSEARLKMAQIPVGASLIANPVSAAPGFKIENVHVMAGVPKIMQAMLDNAVVGLAGGEPILSVSVTCNLPESAVAIALGEIQKQHPDIDIGSYPYFHAGDVGVSLVMRSTDPHALESVAEKVRALILASGGTIKVL